MTTLSMLLRSRSPSPVSGSGRPLFLDHAAVVGLVCIVASLVVGLAINDPRWGIVVPPAAALAVLLGVAAANRGAFLGLALVAVMNAIPFVDLESAAVPGVFRPSDLIVALLVLCLAFWTFNERSTVAVDPRWRRIVWLWSFLFLSWWALTLARSVLFSEIPLLDAILFGRDFLCFALVLPLLPIALRTRRELAGLGWVVGVAAVIFALAQTLTSLLPSAAAAVHTDLFLNPVVTNEFEGIPRIYAPMGDVVTAGAIGAAGFVILARGGVTRIVGAVLFAVLAVGGLVQLSRATYVTMAIGVLVVAVGAAWRSERFHRVVRLLPAVAAIILLVPILVAIRPTDSARGPSIGAILQTRAVSGFAEFQAGTGTFGYRKKLQGSMLDVLGNRWPIGLGFWHPHDRPVPTLPDGSIRNSDVGLFNGLMTFGVVGTLLMYVPFVAIVILLVRQRFKPGGWDGIRLGIAGWVVGIVIGSYTLVTVYSMQGLLLAAVALTVAAGARSLFTEPPRDAASVG